MKILVVDDDPDILEALKRKLEDIGHAVETAQCASDSLDMLDLFKATGVDLIMTDYNMPGGMNGLELGREIRERGFKMPIWLVTGSNINKEVAKSAGITQVISKGTFELFEAIKRLNQKGKEV